MKQRLQDFLTRLESIDETEFDVEDLEDMQNELLKIEKEFEEFAEYELYECIEKEEEEMLDKLAVGDNNYSTFYANFEEQLRRLIKYKKGQLEIYNPEDYLDMMFPNRQDDDFDEDSVSDGIFGSKFD